MAAPTLVTVSFVQSLIAQSASQVTPSSLSWQTGDVVAVLAGTEGAGSETWTAPTTAGSGLTFVQQQLHSSASNCGGACYAAVASAASSGTISLVQPRNAGGTTTAVALAVYVFRGSAGIGLSASGASSARTVSLTPSGADGAIVWGVFDWAATATAAATPTATTHSTAAPGPQASPQAAQVNPRYTYYIEELDDQTSAGAVSYGIGGTGTGPFTIVALEIQASSGGGGGGGGVVVHRRPVNLVPIIRAANF